jgi:hypothetical protein
MRLIAPSGKPLQAGRAATVEVLVACGPGVSAGLAKDSTVTLALGTARSSALASARSVAWPLVDDGSVNVAVPCGTANAPTYTSIVITLGDAVPSDRAVIISLPIVLDGFVAVGVAASPLPTSPVRVGIASISVSVEATPLLQAAAAPGSACDGDGAFSVGGCVEFPVHCSVLAAIKEVPDPGEDDAQLRLFFGEHRHAAVDVDDVGSVADAEESLDESLPVYVQCALRVFASERLRLRSARLNFPVCCGWSLPVSGDKSRFLLGDEIPPDREPPTLALAFRVSRSFNASFQVLVQLHCDIDVINESGTVAEIISYARDVDLRSQQVGGIDGAWR